MTGSGGPDSTHDLVVTQLTLAHAGTTKITKITKITKKTGAASRCRGGFGAAKPRVT